MSWFADMDWIDYNFLLVILLMVSIAIGDYLESIFSWIKLQWKEASPLKRLYIIVAGVIGAALIYLFANLYGQIFLFLSNPTPENKVDSNFALAFLGTVTGLVALFTGFIAILRSETNERQSKAAEEQSQASIEQSKAANKQSEAANKQSEAAIIQSKIAQQQANTAEEGLITDRINKTTEALGKINQKDEPVLEVRIGALYALERIAQDSIRDHLSIIEILCAYIRHNSPETDNTNNMERLRDDIQTAITIIGRREGWPEGKKRLEKEIAADYDLGLGSCNLSLSQLHDVNLNRAKLHFTNLNHSWLWNAKLNNAWLNNTKLKGTHLDAAKTKGAYAYKGDFSECLGLTQEQLNVMYCGKDVEIPTMDGKKKLTRPDHWPTDEIDIDEFLKRYGEWRKTQ